MLPDLEDLYKDIHSHPELSMQEKRTPPWQRSDCVRRASR